MIKGRTSAVVESGILAAVAVVFALVGTYIPFLNIFANFLSPLPILLCGQRNGLRWSILCLVVTGIIVSVLISPIQGLSVIAVFGLIGVVMGECLRRRLSPIKLLGIGSLASIVGLALSFLIGYVVMDINMIQMLQDSLHEALAQSDQAYETLGYSLEQIARTKEEMQKMIKMMIMILPAAFLLMAPGIVFVNYWAARKVLSKLGEDYPWFPKFENWQMPSWAMFLYGISIGGLVYFQGNQESLSYQLVFNGFTFASLVLMLQGMAVIRWYISHKNKPSWWFNVAIFIIFMVSIVGQMVVLLGAYDMLFDFRKLKDKPLLTRKK